MARKSKPSRSLKIAKNTESNSSLEDNILNDTVMTFDLKLPRGIESTVVINTCIFKDQDMLGFLFLTINELPETWYLGMLKIKYKDRVLKDTDVFNEVGFEKSNTLEIFDDEPKFTGSTLRRHLNRIITLLNTDSHRATANHCRSALTEIIGDKDIPIKNDVDYVKEITDLSQITTKIYTMDSWGLRGFKDLYYSSFNPPMPRDSNAGHLAYLKLITLEGVHYGITCFTKGFYVNKITDDYFDPDIHPSHPKVYQNLTCLLIDLSPAFYPIFEKAHSIAKVVVTNVPMYSPQTWYSLDMPNFPCAMRSEFLGYMTGFFQYDENFLANFEFSSAIAINHGTCAAGTEDVLSCSLSVFFHDSLSRTARRVFDGDVTALENDLGYSFGSFRINIINTNDDWAIALNQRNLSNFLYCSGKVPCEKIYPVVMGVVKYRGKRAVGVSLPPNSMQGIYNSTTVGAVRDQFYVDDPYVARLFGDQINNPEVFLPSTVNSVGAKTAEIFGHYTNRLITVNDKLAYAFPGNFSTAPDPNYRENGKVTPLMRSIGFPKKFRHAFAEFRFIALHRLAEFRSFVLFKIQQVIAGQDISAFTIDTFPTLVDACLDEVILGRKNPKFIHILQKLRHNLFGDAETQEEKYVREFLNNKSIARSLLNAFREESYLKIFEACKSFVPKNMTLPYYDVRINSNAYESKDFLVPSIDKSDKMTLAVLAEYNVTIQIPNFIYLQFINENTIFDNTQLLEIWKKRFGLNTRYLGLLAKALKDIEVFSELKKLVVSEIFLRSAKHVFNELISPTDRSQTAKAVSQFLNCVFGFVSTVDVANQSKNVSSHHDAAMFTLTSVSLFVLIADDMREHFDFDIQVKSFADFFSDYGINKLSVLRRLCLLTGLVLTLKDYDFTNETFISAGEVIDIVPIIKGFNFESVITNENYNYALEKIAHGKYVETRVLADMTFKQLESVMGLNLADVGFWLQFFNKMSFRIVSIPLFAGQLHAASIIERTLGPCNYKTVHCYFFTAIVATFHEFYNTALSLCLRVHHLTRLVSGTNDAYVAYVELVMAMLLTLTKHPDAVAVLDICLARKSPAIQHFNAHFLPTIAATYCWHREFRKAISLYREVLAVDDLLPADRAFFDKQYNLCVSDAVKHQRLIKNTNEGLPQEELSSIAEIGNPLKCLGALLFRIVNNVIPDLFEPFTINAVSDCYKAMHGETDKKCNRKKIHRKIRSFD